MAGTRAHLAALSRKMQVKEGMDGYESCGSAIIWEKPKMTLWLPVWGPANPVIPSALLYGKGNLRERRRGAHRKSHTSHTFEMESHRRDAQGCPAATLTPTEKSQSKHPGTSVFKHRGLNPPWYTTGTAINA